ncbi:hypothetical protein KEJ27_06555 [Candidatus Bathyarchaeota archaeon]|nr:hypothetical protein [Candidatus Bathyarchaeota archaeon]MBS7612771.1 hypothetical protein [Candidatus Bathyarchaeota archaeon]MBS7618330.1 hypothetical protein [Candidatus Bathyarchaeota archaeon]
MKAMYSGLKWSGLWLKEFLRRAGLVAINPLKAFAEIGENPDIGGPIAVLVILIIADLINRQLFMLFKTDILILKGSNVLEPYKSSLMDTTTATQIAVMSLINYGYYILRNSIIYYIMMWMLKTERHFTSILMATAYAMFTYVIGKVIEALAILFVIPPLTVVLAVDTSIAMLSSSVTLVLINMENVEVANTMTNTYREVWESQLAPRVLSNMGYAFSIWSCLICTIALYVMFKMHKSKALIAGITPLIVDAILRAVLLGGFF